MADQPRESVLIRDFPGLVTNVDQQDIPPGAADEQVNVASIIMGELQVRAGYRVVSFDP